MSDRTLNSKSTASFALLSPNSPISLNDGTSHRTEAYQLFADLVIFTVLSEQPLLWSTFSNYLLSFICCASFNSVERSQFGRSSRQQSDFQQPSDSHPPVYLRPSSFVATMQLPSLKASRSSVASSSTSSTISSLFIPLLLGLPSICTAVTFDCDHVRVDGRSYNFNSIRGPHSVLVVDDGHPPAVTNTTWTVDMCAPLKENKDVPVEDTCPKGTRSKSSIFHLLHTLYSLSFCIVGRPLGLCASKEKADMSKS